MRYLLLTTFFFFACETVEIKERVIYEDGTPVVSALIHQYTDEGFNGYTFTDAEGIWELDVPPDSAIHLCIENPRENNDKICYDGDLVTPAINSGKNQMERI